MNARIHDLYRPVAEPLRDFHEGERTIPGVELFA